MIDIQFIRDNPDLVREKAAQKLYPVDVDALLRADEDRRAVLLEVEQLRQRRNTLADATKSGGKPEPALIEEGKNLKIALSKQEAYLADAEARLLQLMKQVPNMPLDDVPVGASEDENQVAKQWGQIPTFDFEPKNHWQIAETRGMIDKERAAKVAGSRFAYLKGDIVRLQFAIVQWVLTTLSDEAVIAQIIKDEGLSIAPKAFVPVLPPAMIKTEVFEAMDRLEPRDERYRVGDETDELWLQGSAEHTLGPMYKDEMIPEADLPIRYVGYSSSFRREAGTYGKDMEGIIRMHQFDKLEMEVFSTADTGLEEHKLLAAIQEYLMRELKIPYQILLKCTADIGKPNARGIDVEAWLPGQNKYRETHTADYMTDYQSRRLKCRVRKSDGTVEFAHTNDATAFAVGRLLVAIIENFQQADGKISIPEVLRPFMGGARLL